MNRWIVAVILAALSISALGFNINGAKWPGGRTHLYTSIPGTAASGLTWSQALRDAAQEWNEKTVFKFESRVDYRDPCVGYRNNPANSEFPAGDGDGVNGADFTSDVCGNAYGLNVLAVTLVYTESNRLGALDITEADMVFNKGKAFDIYDGPASGASGTDFTRVALHELGHVMGMGHEDTRAAIMRPNIGSTFTLQADDIAGANKLYGGYSNCQVSTLNFGAVGGQLASGDCIVKELVGGGTDTSLADVYEFELLQSTSIVLNMQSSVLDSVLVLMDARSAVLVHAGEMGGSCHSQIRTTLPAGTYAVLANTFTESANPNFNSTCKNVGAYSLTMSYTSTAPLALGRPASFLGGTATAGFFGGVTTDKGKTFGSGVTSTQRFDVVGRIDIDPLHRNKAGFLVVAALLDNGEILVKNLEGQFLPLGPQSSPVPITTGKVLGSSETIEVLSDIVASELGLRQINVRFLIGYGLSSQPNELYFHREPISLVISP
ncbi:MAG: matrixin family metalloprotease [Gammaproteobacteria bacterium]|nr:matrixin family metalloprotease [Gammaproteobacteria bacterium]